MASLQEIFPNASDDASRIALDVKVKDDTLDLFGIFYTPDEVWKAMNAEHGFRSWDDSPPTPFVNDQWQVVSPHEIPWRVKHKQSRVHSTVSRNTGRSDDETLRIRWITPEGTVLPWSHQWDLPSTNGSDSKDAAWGQYTQPGHLFLITTVSHSTHPRQGATLFDDATIPHQEHIVGGFRPMRGTPSGRSIEIVVSSSPDQLPHYEVQIRVSSELGGGRGSNDVESTEDARKKTLFDQLTVVAADWEYQWNLSRTSNSANSSSSATETSSADIAKSLRIVAKLLSNLLQHPEEEKFQTIRGKNQQIAQYVVSSWNAMQILQLVGFDTTVDTDDGLAGTSPTNASQSRESTDQNRNSSHDTNPWAAFDGTITPEAPATEPSATVLTLRSALHNEGVTPAAVVSNCQMAVEFIRLLQSRMAPDFVSETAPMTPWNIHSNISTPATTPAAWGNGGRGWLTDEERWERADRVSQLRRSGAMRRPEPGQAPSSRGKWGR